MCDVRLHSSWSAVRLPPPTRPTTPGQGTGDTSGWDSGRRAGSEGRIRDAKSGPAHRMACARPKPSSRPAGKRGTVPRPDRGQNVPVAAETRIMSAPVTDTKDPERPDHVKTALAAAGSVVPVATLIAGQPTDNVLKYVTYLVPLALVAGGSVLPYLKKDSATKDLNGKCAGRTEREPPTLRRRTRSWTGPRVRALVTLMSIETTLAGVECARVNVAKKTIQLQVGSGRVFRLK